MITNDVRFFGYRGFYVKRNYIKNQYIKFEKRDKWAYKWYVYSRRGLKEYTCDLIWSFLNDEVVDEFLVTEEILKNECHKYRM